jgi:hypothetical protein
MASSASSSASPAVSTIPAEAVALTTEGSKVAEVARKRKAGAMESSSSSDDVERNATMPPAWERKFQLLIKFRAEHGHVRVPQSLNSKEYAGLGVWVNNKRAAYRNETLRAKGQQPKSTARISHTQIARLESLGFEWGRSIASAAWDRNFERLAAYVAAHGTARVPASLDTAEYPRLGKWVVNQRQAFRFEAMRSTGAPPRRRANRICPEQIERLNRLNFEWVVGEQQHAPRAHPHHHRGRRHRSHDC